MKKRKKNHSRLWTIGVLAILLCIAPCDAIGEIIVDSDETLNVGTGYPDVQIDDYILVNGTLNLYPGAYVNESIYALGGSTVNIYGGELGSDSYFFSVCSGVNGVPDPVVTVYGTDFAVNNISLDDSVTQYTPKDTSQSWILTVTYANGVDPINLKFYSYGGVPVYLEKVENETDIEVMIDIKPGGNPNNINLKSKGVVPVALLTAGDFEAGDIDPGSVEFAGASPVRSKLCDVDEDGDMDMLFHFKTKDLVELNEDSTEATLTATIDGVQIEATDQVRIVPCKKKNYHSSNGKYKYSNRYTPKHKRPVRNRKDR